MLASALACSIVQKSRSVGTSGTFLDDGFSFAEYVSQMITEIDLGRVDQCGDRFVDVDGAWPLEVDVAGVPCSGVSDEKRLTSLEEPAVRISVEDARQ